ncbi:hypothetical protein M8A51_18100 [Schlegelella sp. S2-27]|uniref:Uncharacterized protein n=1 Tax=Caldimonas mangrovi TaxID=2944811 RepID=A0ABT0YRT7_9BURK|nr:hypothetical protein [Caldimonas mangrovi]MCM5681444.1 hypothetical protein [Caldimonas mangrovi]
MISIQFVVAAVIGWLVLGALQWQLMASRHRQHLARMHDRYRRTQQHTEQMLSNCRRQVVELQKTLRMCHESAQARSAVTQAATASTPVPRSAARDTDLLFHGDTRPRDPYVDAVLHFAETRPMLSPNTYRPSDSAARRLAGMPEHGFAPTISFGDMAPLPSRKADIWAHERLA